MRLVKQMQDFRDVLDDCVFTYLGFVGNKFTWGKKLASGIMVWERLEKAIANNEWISLFPATKVVHLECGMSDHNLSSLTHLVSLFTDRSHGGLSRFSFETLDAIILLLQCGEVLVMLLAR